MSSSALPPNERTRTPPQSHAKHNISSPVKLRSPYAENKRDEVQKLALRELKQFKSEQEYLDFLRVPTNVLKNLELPSDEFSLGSFVQVANTLASSMKGKHFANSPLLVFKSTENKAPRGHVTDTECRPDFVAAIERDWYKNTNTTLWPCIRLAGEQASKGKTLEEQGKQAMSYLHYLLLARPDLHVAQGLLTSPDGITFFVGIGGLGIRRFFVRWEDDVYRLMYAFVYRLYNPGDFGDPSYLSMTPNFEKDFVTYTIRITVNGGDPKKHNSIDCSDFSPIYASNPFESRTHIFTNPQSAIKIGGKVLRVIKDQLCNIGTRFDEHAIITRVHTPEKVPGVVEAVHHESIEIPPVFDVCRVKQRLGLRQIGSPITSSSTLQSMLERAFDVLEVLRYLRFNRQVLHRDISRGNVLYLEEEARLLDSETDGANSIESEGGEVPLCFIKYLLKESTAPRETSILLIDFNHAEHLESKEGSEYERVVRTGTPVFIARAIQQGKPVSLPKRTFMCAVPIIPDDYARHHPERVEKFPFEDERLVRPSTDNSNRKWRHELDHDAESVFWLLIYWLIGAQPIKGPKTNIGVAAWGQMMGGANDRISFIGSLGIGGRPDGLMHPIHEPLYPLLSDLAAILMVDRYWLDENDTRNDPGYVPEAFQRLIFKFILDNRGEQFMEEEVSLRYQRHVDEITNNLNLSVTTGQERHAEGSRNLKRPSPEPPKQREKRPRMANKMVEGSYYESDEENLLNPDLE